MYFAILANRRDVIIRHGFAAVVHVRSCDELVLLQASASEPAHSDAAQPYDGTSQ
jgi:hypothetical protein